MPAAVAPSSALPITKLILWARPSWSRRHPDFALNDADRAQRHVVRPEIEGRAAPQIETGMMPMAGEDAILDAAAVQRKAHVRAAVVQCDHLVACGRNKHRAARRADHQATAVV